MWKKKKRVRSEISAYSVMTRLRCHLLLWSCFLIKQTLSSVPPIPNISSPPFSWQPWIKYSLFTQVLSAVRCAALLLIGRQSSVSLELVCHPDELFLLMAKPLISAPPILGKKTNTQTYLLPSLMQIVASVNGCQQDGCMKVGKLVDCLTWAHTGHFSHWQFEIAEGAGDVRFMPDSSLYMT